MVGSCWVGLVRFRVFEWGFGVFGSSKIVGLRFY